MGKGNGYDLVEAKGAGVSPPGRVAIVALGPSSLQYVQECDVAGDRHKVFDETWTVNSYTSIIQAERIFHMDDVRIQEIRAAGGNTRVEYMLKALKRHKGPIYTSFAHPDYPALVEFPLRDVIQKLGSIYFNNTMAYAIAYAAFIGVKSITLFGLDFTWPNIHQAEQGRACCEYWLGRAHGMGIQFNIASQSTLMDMRTRHADDLQLYGYDAVKLSVEDDNGKAKLIFEDRDLPSAEEIEKKYDHKTWLKKQGEMEGGVVTGGTLPPSETRVVESPQ